jgi:hypothetical protein
MIYKQLERCHIQKKIKKFVDAITGFWSEDRNLSILLGFILFDFFVLPSLTGLIGKKIIIHLLNNLIFSFLLLFGVLAFTRHKASQFFFALIIAFIITVRWVRLISVWPGCRNWILFFQLLLHQPL